MAERIQNSHMEAARPLGAGPLKGKFTGDPHGRYAGHRRKKRILHRAYACAHQRRGHASGPRHPGEHPMSVVDAGHPLAIGNDIHSARDRYHAMDALLSLIHI